MFAANLEAASLPPLRTLPPGGLFEEARLEDEMPCLS